MLVELSPEEITIIEQWYCSAAGESASGARVYPRYYNRTAEAKARYSKDVAEAQKVRALIAKLGFKLHYMDEGALEEK